MENKICPLFWASDEIPAEACKCKGTACAWYVPPLHRGDEGHCAMQDLAALSLIASEVGKL